MQLFNGLAFVCISWEKLHSDLLQLSALVTLHWVFFGFRPTSALLDSNQDWEQAIAWRKSLVALAVLHEHVMLVTSKDLIDILQSCDAWANILKDNGSSFMIDLNGAPNHDALPTP